MAKTKPFHFKHGLSAELKDVVEQLKGIAAEFKTAFHDAGQHPTVKAFAHESRQTAAEVKAVMQNVREDIKLVFKSAGEQISELFRDAGERLAAVNGQAHAAQQDEHPAEAATRIVCDRGRVHDSSDHPVEAQLTGMTAADTAEMPLHG